MILPSSHLWMDMMGNLLLIALCLEFHRDPESQLILPVGVTRLAMLAMLEDLKQDLGSNNVLIDIEEDGIGVEGDLFRSRLGGKGAFQDGQNIMPGEDKFSASVVVTPGCAEDVQKSVRLGQWFSLTRLFSADPDELHGQQAPRSHLSRQNLGYGGWAPRLSGSIIVNLGARITQVLIFNLECFYTVVEPGVLYFQLDEELVKAGLCDKMWIDCPDLGWGSVLGNMMDRGVSHTPYGDHFVNHVGMEIVLPNGEVIYTGMGRVFLLAETMSDGG